MASTEPSLSSPVDLTTADSTFGVALGRAMAALAPQHASKARRLALSEACVLARMLTRGAEERAQALANRFASESEVAAAEAVEETCEGGEDLEVAISERLGLLHCGAALLRVGEDRQRERELTEATAALCTAAHALGEPIARDSDTTSAKAGLYERQAFGMWARALELLRGLGSDGASDAARAARFASTERAVHELGVQRRVWLNPMQRPVELLERRLRARCVREHLSTTSTSGSPGSGSPGSGSPVNGSPGSGSGSGWREHLSTSCACLPCRSLETGGR